ncbi:hypothetical protein HK405_009938, partial [Cladochytrium tenue]
MLDADSWQRIASLALNLGLLVWAVRRWIPARNMFNCLCVTACLLSLVSVVIVVVYDQATWINPRPRYVLFYLGLGSSNGLMYHLYERRLVLFFVRGATVFRAAVRSLLAVYALVIVTISIDFAVRAGYTTAGKATTDGPEEFPLKLGMYIADMTIGCVILGGTVVALGRTISDNNKAGGAAGRGGGGAGIGAVALYRAIVLSDCTKFSMVIVIEIYKAACSVDPTGASGGLPVGNQGFQSLLNVVKFAILLFNIYMPSGISDLLSTSTTTKSAIILIYGVVSGLNAPVRYVTIYIGINGPFALLYAVYTRRLEAFFTSGARTFRVLMIVLIAMYLAVTTAAAILFPMHALNTESGGYTSVGAAEYELKVTMYTLDMAVGFAIFVGTLASLGRTIAASGGIGGVMVYKAILYSDCLRFLVVIAIEAYKTATSTDVTANTGVLPSGNLGFQHLIDTIKFTVMMI